MILHDLGQRFNSPTVNLSVSLPDFMLLVGDLKENMGCELIEMKDDSVSFPVGVLGTKKGDVRINFVHYPTFDIAKKKWKERVARINWDNIFILLEGYSFEKELLNECEHVEYPLAVMGPKSMEFEPAYPFYHGFDWYCNWYSGKSLDYKHIFGLKRYLDDFDCIKFLNGNES